MGTKVIPRSGGDVAGVGNYNTSTGAASGEESALVLTSDVERWLDADNGSDGNDGTEAAPWLSFAPWNTLLAQYVAINNAVATLNILTSTAGPSLIGTTLPALRGTAKVVIRGDQDQNMPNTGGAAFTVVGGVGSTTAAMHVALWPSDNNPVGWQIHCTAGANIGSRRHVASWTAGGEGGPATLVPAAPWSFTSLGDTFELIRPASILVWPGGEVLNSAGPTDIDGPGLYLSRLQVRGTPTLSYLTTWIYACEYFVDVDDSGDGFQLSDRTFTGIGVADGTALPWVHADAGLWNGCGLAQRFEELDTASTDLIVLFADDGDLIGYWCGTDWSVSGSTARGNQYGGALWGQIGGGAVQPNILAANGGRATAGTLANTTPIEIKSILGSAPGAIYATDPGSVINVGLLVFSSPSPTLLRATNWGVIDVDGTIGAGPSGASAGSDAQDATGQGTIIWNTLPALTAAFGKAQLRVDGLTAANTALTAVPSVVRDGATGLSLITRRATTTPVASAPSSATMIGFTASNPSYALPTGMKLIGAWMRPGAGGGGGGGTGGAGATANNGGGGGGGPGGAGASCTLDFAPITAPAGSILAITIGAGGAGGTAGSLGSDGGTTSIAIAGGATLVTATAAISTGTSGNGGAAGNTGTAGTTTAGAGGAAPATRSGWPNLAGAPANGAGGLGGGTSAPGQPGITIPIRTNWSHWGSINAAAAGVPGNGGAASATRGGGGGGTAGVSSYAGDEYVSALGLPLPPATGAGSGRGGTPAGTAGDGNNAGVGNNGAAAVNPGDSGSLGRGGGGGAGGGGGGASNTTGGSGGAGSAGGRGSDGAVILVLAPA